MKFYWFGDSWVAGDELYKIVPHEIHQQYAFPKLVSDHYGAECINLGKNGHSPDILPYIFSDIVDQIDPTVDKVFFFLSAANRTWMFNEQGEIRCLGLDPATRPNCAHQYHNEWMKFFDNNHQRIYNYDRTINLLYFWCKHLGVDFYLSNIFTTAEQSLMDQTGDDGWLLPRDRCIAESILSFNDNKYGQVIVNDVPQLLDEQWEIQKLQVEKYIKPLICHPNIEGHRQIADYIIDLLDKNE